YPLRLSPVPGPLERLDGLLRLFQAGAGLLAVAPDRFDLPARPQQVAQLSPNLVTVLDAEVLENPIELALDRWRSFDRLFRLPQVRAGGRAVRLDGGDLLAPLQALAHARRQSAVHREAVVLEQPIDSALDPW